MNFLRPIERIIIESIYDKDKNIQTLSEDIGLMEDSLFFPLQQLILKNFLVFHKGFYSINTERIVDIKVHLENKTSKKFEIKTILESAKKNYLENDINHSLQIKKVCLSNDDQSIVNSLLKQLDQFLTTRGKEAKQKPICKKEIFFWGRQTYQDVIDHLNCA